MPVQISTIEALARQRLDEPVPRYWSSQELTDIIIAGIRDLWRSAVDLKQEYFFVVNETDVSLPANSDRLVGVPGDVYKVYLVESLDPVDLDRNIVFMPVDYNDKRFIDAKGRSTVSPPGETIYYSIVGQGAPVNAPTIYIAPTVNSNLAIRFAYIPTLGNMSTDTFVPIPGEVNNALVAWTVAYARAKERDDRAPDPAWIAIYATEKANILQGLGVRQLQEGVFVDAVFEEYWN